MRRLAMMLTVVAMLVGATAPTVLANGATDQATKEAAGWGCASAVGLPAGHCISPGTVKRWPEAIFARGGTFQLLVFDEFGNFSRAEIATSQRGNAKPRPFQPSPKMLTPALPCMSHVSMLKNLSAGASPVQATTLTRRVPASISRRANKRFCPSGLRP